MLTHRSMNRTALALVVAVLLAAAPVLAEKQHPGYVDCTPLIALAGGDEAVTIEVSLSGKLLRALCKFDEELYKLCADVHSIQAVIMELDRSSNENRDLPAVRDAIRKMGNDLKSRGWERVTRIREDEGEIQVLVLSVDEEIHGLLVLVIEGEDEMICANIAGKIDLEAIQGIGQGLGIPGLDSLEEWKDDN